ncbi:MAG: rubredoxin [Fibrobacteraceae bacterium]|nr:rubredoxin [Fibrobacteraceae bacterium]
MMIYRKYICRICGYIYDEAKGIPSAGIAPGTLFDDLPDSFVCPKCKADKSHFKLLEE